MFAQNYICGILTGADPGFDRGGGPRSGTMKIADVAKRSRASEVSLIGAGGPGPAQGPRKLWGF